MAGAESADKPSVMVLNLPGGGMYGIVPLAVLARLEELTGRPVTELFQVMEGGSVSAFLIAGMQRPDPKDPSKPMYDMKKGLELFVERTPGVFPQIPQRYAKMAADQAAQQLKEMLEKYASLDWDIPDDSMFDFIDDATRAIRVAAIGPSYLALTGVQAGWARDYMFDPKKLERLFKDVLGETTRLSDVVGTVYLPAYNALTGQIEFFTARKEDILNANGGNSEVSHNNPYLWQIAMAATANVSAYPPYLLGKNAVYTDGAMFHKPGATLAHIAAENPGIPLKLVQIGLKPSRSTFTENGNGDRAALRDGFHKDGAVGGLAKGRLGHVFNYGADLERQTLVSLLGGDPENLIVIAPPENIKGLGLPPGWDPLDASDGNIDKLLNYARLMIVHENASIKDLARTLVRNLHARGVMDDKQLERTLESIDKSKLNDSTVLPYLDQLAAESGAPLPGHREARAPSGGNVRPEG